ncbi:DnaJ-domain-containing protein [Hypoxylon crocopeplum]|nr:DnaJ-domain-containing protein [Hypoxylon crocopeplum]
MSPLPPDPYRILGVPKDVQLPEIRSAYKKLVLKCHPDKFQDPKLKEEKQKEFQQVQQAYELLGNEVERTRYDDKVRLEELRRERGTTSTSSPRTSKRHETRYYDVREAEPRSATFASSPGTHNVYSATPPSRSWDEDLYSPRRFEEKIRRARKTTSYEEYEREKPSRKDEERRRRKEDEEWIREKERAREREKDIKEAERKERDREQRDREVLKEREKEREVTKKEKDRRKDERKEEKKRTEKERRKESDEKHTRQKSPYVEVYPEEREEVVYTTSSSSKPDKKRANTSRKYEEAPPPPPPREGSRPPATDRERKNSATLESAIRYLSRSGGKAPPLPRAQTYHEYTVRHVAPIAVPTPPPAAGAPFPPPPVSSHPREHPLEDDTVKRSSARPRRMSHDTPRLSKEKSSHKKSSSSREAIIVDASPSPATRAIPTFQKSHSIPIPPIRANTDNYSRPPLAPGLERAATFDEFGRDRSRSRPARMYPDDSSEDDRDRRHRRSRRTQSPEPMIQSKRYTVDSNRKAIPIHDSYFPEDSPRSSRKNSYPIPNSSVRRTEPRANYYVAEEYDDDAHFFSGSVKFADQFKANDIKYSDVPHTTYREEVF